ncbi:MAG: bifunctional diaminohydroxyphosphoribosylaminopyrimidine deaminase/5-amino-6-(5-phosphoribosylamino)uracil reductase RibD [Flavobacteriales bacterium]|nr:bifunctional diaminohydroxyphosphoribosylaminopyrimidine deaminase/5-amino-6-(5-phosphoribosylamino)uracil reductase RibD [Flavobacteriales bacterium]
MEAADGLELWMQRALDLARRGTGNVSPNPKVGAVIVHRNRILGEGYHSQFGGPHAEVHAIQKVADKNLLKQSSLFVNLEPCSHHGKTPPCADLIIEMGIPEVFIAMEDPNPLVAGSGIDRMKKAGIRVHVGMLNEEARALNRVFCTNILHRRPHYLAKWAVTADGFMGRAIDDEGPKQISGSLSSLWVHRLRSEVDAILIGAGTALADDPMLTNRKWPGKSPKRIILDSDNLCPSEIRMFNDKVPMILFRTEPDPDFPDHVEQIILRRSEDYYEQIDQHLLKRDIAFVLVEGGRLTLQKLQECGRMDEAWVLRNPNLFWERGIEAPYPINLHKDFFQLGNDHLKYFEKPVFAE